MAPLKGRSKAAAMRRKPGTKKKWRSSGSVRRAESVLWSVPRPVPILDLRMTRLRGSRTGQIDSAHPPYETTPSDPREKAARSERVRERGRLAGPAIEFGTTQLDGAVPALALLLRVLACVRCAPTSRPTRPGPLLVPSVGCCKSRAIRRRCRVGRARARASAAAAVLRCEY